MARRVTISDESFSMLEDIPVSMDYIIGIVYGLTKALKSSSIEERAEEGCIRIQHLKITDSEMEKLQEKYNQKSIDEVLDGMRNYSKLKKYKNGYLTANKWLQSRGKQALKGNGVLIQVGSKEWMEANG